MRSHRSYFSSSSNFMHPSSSFGGDVYDTLHSSNSHYNLTQPRRTNEMFNSNANLNRSSINLTKSFNNLSTLDKKANADPELTRVRKSKNGYHLSVDLNAYMLNGSQRPASSMQLHQSNYLQQQQMQQRQSLLRGGPSRGGLDGGSRISMVNLYDPQPQPMPAPIETRPMSTHSSYNQKTIINLEGARNTHQVAPSNTQDTYIMKSIKPSTTMRREETTVEGNKENIEFDLCLFGTVNKKVEKVIEKPKVKKVSESRANVREVVEESESRTQVSLPSLNIRPPKPKKPNDKISKGMVDNLNNAKFELEEDEQEMLERLLRGAPRDSHKKQINVERETEEIFGPLPEEEVEKLYSKEMINVDVISEVVHLEVEDGVADLQLKLTFNKIVPVEDSRDTFKMTKVVVTKQIMVDLRVTEERQKICEEIMQIQRNGVLDREYTWMLYRIFSTLADAENALGVSESKVRVEKEVGEERVRNLNREMFKSRGNTDRKFQILEKTFLEDDEPNLTSEVSTGWSYNSGQRNSVARDRQGYHEGHASYRYAVPRHETIESKDYFSEVDTRRAGSRIDEASMNLHGPGDPSWKHQFSRWLSSENDHARSRSQRLDVYNYLRPGGSRNYDYLIDDALHLNGGSANNSRTSYYTSGSSFNTDNRNKYTSNGFNPTFNKLSKEESISTKVLNEMGLKGGKHRERMRSYERGLDHGSEDNDRSQYTTRTSRRENYTRNLL